MNDSVRVYRKFMRMTEEHRMLGCSSVVVAFSGGADSAVLLHLLSGVCAKRGIRLYALHVHHGIRGKAADRDARFCQQFCQNLGIELKIVRFNVPALAKQQKRGIEETARDCRYTALTEFCAQNGVDRIAVAHHANDNLETLLLWLIRGAGITGGSGIAPVRGNIIRPLLSCSKEEILGYAREKNIPYVTDDTNADPGYTRNYLRHRVVPLLTSVNPSLPDAALRFCRLLREDDSALSEIASEYGGDLSCAGLAALHPAIRRRVIRSAYADRFGGTLSLDQTEFLMHLVDADREGSQICLPGGIIARILNHELVFGRRSDSPVPVQSYRYQLRLGENSIPEIGALICLYDKIGKNEEKEIKEKQNIYKLFIHRSLDFAKIAYSDLVVRNKTDGDWIRYGQMTRRVKKLLWERKIPPDRRALYPVVEDGREILFMPGFPVCDRAAPSDGCRLLHLCFFALSDT